VVSGLIRTFVISGLDLYLHGFDRCLDYLQSPLRSQFRSVFVCDVVWSLVCVVSGLDLCKCEQWIRFVHERI